MLNRIKLAWLNWVLLAAALAAVSTGAISASAGRWIVATPWLCVATLFLIIRERRPPLRAIALPWTSQDAKEWLERHIPRPHVLDWLLREHGGMRLPDEAGTEISVTRMPNGYYQGRFDAGGLEVIAPSSEEATFMIGAAAHRWHATRSKAAAQAEA
jgi:hypothetical protein